MYVAVNGTISVFRLPAARQSSSHTIDSVVELIFDAVLALSRGIRHMAQRVATASLLSGFDVASR